jgi:hypothetical protein
MREWVCAPVRTCLGTAPISGSVPSKRRMGKMNKPEPIDWAGWILASAVLIVTFLI